MKNVIIIIISAIMGVLMLLMGMTIHGRMNRSMELAGSLSTAVEETVSNAALEKKYDVNNINEYLADIVQGTADALDADGKVQAEVTGIDKERGVAGIRITETYEHPNGSTGTLTYEKTAVVDGKKEGVLPESHTVSFYLSKEDMLAGVNCYKKSAVSAGDAVQAPAVPAGGAYRGWKDINDYIGDFSVPVAEDRAYYAY